METSERHCTRTAVFVILERDNHVFLLRRANTGWRDGMLTLPSGHVDKGQTVREAAVVEAREEAMVEIDEADLEFVHVDYLRDLYTNFYFRARKWTGEPTLGEPHLASEVLWAPKDALPKDVVPQLKPMFAGIARGEHFSEWDEN